MIKKTKWYNSRWFYLGVIVLIIIIALYAATKSVAYFNYTELLKTENAAKSVEIDSLKKNYDKLFKQKERVKIIREKINTEEEDQRIAYLEQELLNLRRAKEDTIVKKDTPEQLYKYFNNIK